MEEIIEQMKIEKYSNYKDSGIEWLGEMPAEWQLLSNKYIFNLKKNQVGKKSGNYVLLSLTLNGVIKRDMENPQGKFPAEFDTYQEVKKGDFIFCLFDVEETPRAVGLSDYDGMITGAYTVMEPVANFDRTFLYYFYLNLDADKRMRSLYKGLRNTIPKESFFSFKTFVPPLKEQTAIASFLDRKTAQIDKAISIKEQQIELLKERRQILIHQAVTQGLNPNVKMKDTRVEWIGEIPEHWDLVPVRRIMDIRDGTHDTPAYVEDGVDAVPLVTSKDFENGLIKFENIKKISRKDHISISKRSAVNKDDVLMSMIGGNIGKSVIVGDYFDFSVKNVALFKTLGDNFLAKYLLFYFESGLLQNQIDLKSRGGAQGFLSLGDIRNLVFFKLPLEERNKIVHYLESNISLRISSAITCKEKEIEKLKEYKATLINSAVTGKIKVV